MAKTKEADTARLWEGLARAHNTMTAALEKDMLPGAGVPLGWFEVLNHLTRAPGGLLRFQELAKVAGITDSGASRRLDQMIKAGLIERQECPTDRRGAFAHITVKGKAGRQRPLPLGSWRWVAAAIVAIWLFLTIIVPLSGIAARRPGASRLGPSRRQARAESPRASPAPREAPSPWSSRARR